MGSQNEKSSVSNIPTLAFLWFDGHIYYLQQYGGACISSVILKRGASLQIQQLGLCEGWIFHSYALGVGTAVIPHNSALQGEIGVLRGISKFILGSEP